MKIPTGFLSFHRDKFLNFQLNRWYSLAFTRREDLERVAANTRTFQDCVEQFMQAADLAVAEKRLKNAAFYYRAAEFLLPPDNANKLPLYEKFSSLFYQAFAEENIERHEVPYAGSCLPAMRLSSATGEVKGTILIFGGFDSFIEEFFCIWKYFSARGYEVIAFEGPGQGGRCASTG